MRSPFAFVAAAAIGALLAIGPMASLAQETGGDGSTGSSSTGETTTGGSTSTTPPSTTVPSTTTSPSTTTRPTTTRPPTTTVARTTVRRPPPPRRPPKAKAKSQAKAPPPTAASPAPAAGAPIPPAVVDGSFASAGSPPAAASVAFITPFPVVRIAGSLTRSGARIRLLSVRAPAGTVVIARCRGRACPPVLRRRRLLVRMAANSGRARLRAMERVFRAGVRLEVLVSKPGLYGKHTRFAIRRGRAPARRDMCLAPDARVKPARCPGSPRPGGAPAAP